MCKITAKLYCPSCDQHFAPEHYMTLLDDPRRRCSMCHDLLVCPADLTMTVWPTIIIQRNAGKIARSLIARGLLDALAERQGRADSNADARAFGIARTLLKEAAKL